MKAKLLATCAAGALWAWTAQAQSTPVVQGNLAHIAAGGAWQTTITLLNLSASAVTATVSLYSDSGTPLTVTNGSQVSASSFQVQVPANGTNSLLLANVGTTVQVGSAQVTLPAGSSSNIIQGQATFYYQPGNWAGVVPVTPAGTPLNLACIIPLPVTPPSKYVMPFDTTTNATTNNPSVMGFAVANITGSAQAVTLEVDDQNNAMLATEVINLPANGHLSFTLDQRYGAAVTGHQGTLRVSATAQSISLLAFIVEGNGGFSTILPIAH